MHSKRPSSRLAPQWAVTQRAWGKNVYNLQKHILQLGQIYVTIWENTQNTFYDFMISIILANKSDNIDKYVSWFGQIYQIIVTNMCVLIWKFNSYSVQCDEIWAYSYSLQFGKIHLIWRHLTVIAGSLMQFGHIHFIFGTNFVYDLEKYTWFEKFNI